MPRTARKTESSIRADRAPREPVWTADAPDEALSILEHAEAIAMVDELRPYCSGWSVELLRPDIANEVGLILGGAGKTALWAIYRDADRVLHFEDLTSGASYTFGTISAGLRFVRAVIEAAAFAAETPAVGAWWNRLPRWLVEESPLQPGR